MSIPITINMFNLSENKLAHSEAFLLEHDNVYIFSNNSDSQNLINIAEKSKFNIYRPTSDAFLFYQKEIKNQKDYSSCSIIADFIILKIHTLFQETNSRTFTPKVISHSEIDDSIEQISGLVPTANYEIPCAKISANIKDKHNYFVIPQQITDHSQTSPFYNINQHFHKKYQDHDYYKIYNEHYKNNGKGNRIKSLPEQYIKHANRWE